MTGVSKNPLQIEKMFNDIASGYDRNNNIISLGLHKIIKRFAIKNLSYKSDMRVADLCCGTGDITNILKTVFEPVYLVGLDFSEKMIDIAKRKFPDINFIKADATNLPFKENSFDAITMSFGLRNIENRGAAIKEGYRVLKNGGEFLHLDFGDRNIFSHIFDFLVLIGMGVFYKNKIPYNYLVKSKNEFPVPKKLIEEFLSEGFVLKKEKTFLFGVIGVQIFCK